ncbi:hypothetical protein KA005_85340 [bacterium]|nr:hypothetical protein [bacterium]
MAGNKIHQDLIAEVKKILNPFRDKLLIEKHDGVGLIQVFSEEKMTEGEKNKFKIAFSDMLILDGKSQPFIVIEPETSTSPKTFGRSIPVYTIAKQIIADRQYQVKSPLFLIIVIPDYKKNPSQKKYQLEDLKRKIKSAIKLEGSQLEDFAFCQISDFEETFNKMIEASGNQKP